MTEALYIPVSNGEELGIGTKGELEALIADGILPADTTLELVTPTKVREIMAA